MSYREATRSSIDFTAAMPGSSWYRRATARARQIEASVISPGTPIFKTGFELTPLRTLTRLASTSCCRGAAYGAGTLKAENSRVFSSSKASMNHPTGTVFGGNDGTLMTRPHVRAGMQSLTAQNVISSVQG